MAPTPNISLTLPAQGTTPWDAIVNGNFTIIDNCLGGSQVIPGINVTAAQIQSLSKYGGVPTVAGGLAAIIAKADLTAQQANVGSTLLYAVPANGAGMYRVQAYVVVTQAASVSSTMPAAVVAFTDNDTNVSTQSVPTQTSPGNVLGTNSANAIVNGASGVMIFNAKASTNINFSTQSYASSGATPMQYAVHVKLEYLGL